MCTQGMDLGKLDTSSTFPQCFGIFVCKLYVCSEYIVVGICVQLAYFYTLFCCEFANKE